MSDLKDIPGVGPAITLGLANIGITTTEALSRADVATLSQVRGISETRAERFIATAKTALATPDTPNEIPVSAKPTKKSKPSKAKSKAKKEKKAKKDKKKADKSGSDKKSKKTKKKT